MKEMMAFYAIGYVILFIAILIVGSYALANDEEDKRDVMELLTSLIIFPFFSWLMILVIALVMFFIYLKEPE